MRGSLGEAARRTLSIAVATSALVSLHASVASADVQTCLSASERGQRARASGKLREARDEFLTCSSDECPAMVRRDCAQWQGELVHQLPSVVFGAKDKQGRDLFDVTVSMDGQAIVKELDGKAIAIDPGPHTFTFEAAGGAPVIERALVKEGEKSRAVTVTFTDLGGMPAVTSTAAHPSPGGESPPATRGGHTVLPWIVVGLGAAAVVTGAVIFLTAPSLPAGCDTNTGKCAPISGESPTEFEQRKSDAGLSQAQPTEGLVVGAIGLGVVGAGLLWHFLEPSAKPATASALTMTPWAGPGVAGAALGATF